MHKLLGSRHHDRKSRGEGGVGFRFGDFGRH
jgi:hypothetical protein